MVKRMADLPTKQSKSLFPKKLVTDMRDAGVSFGTVFHIPSLDINNIPRDLTNEFLEEVEGPVVDKLKQSWPELFEKYITDFENTDEELFVEAIVDLGQKQLLINVKVNVPTDFSYDDEGRFAGCSMNNGYYNYWLFANDFAEAAQIAIKIGEELFVQELELDRKNKGIPSPT